MLPSQFSRPHYLVRFLIPTVPQVMSDLPAYHQHKSSPVGPARTPTVLGISSYSFLPTLPHLLPGIDPHLLESELSPPAIRAASPHHSVSPEQSLPTFLRVS